MPPRPRPASALPRSRALLVVLALALTGACSGQGRAPSGTTPTRATSTQTTAREPARYAFPVQPLASCKVSYGHFHHDYPATDIFAEHGCRFVAPTDGTVTEVARVDRWDPSSDRGADRGGRSVAMVGTDGVRYYGSHLERVAAGIAPGAQVRAGQLLGLIDNSGDARSTPTHLHFGISWPTRRGIWWVRRGVVAPWPYLDSWRAGGSRSPAPAVRAALADAGTREPRCRSGC